MGSQILCDNHASGGVAGDEARRERAADGREELEGRTLVLEPGHTRACRGVVRFSANPCDDGLWEGTGAARRLYGAARDMWVVRKLLYTDDVRGYAVPRGKQFLDSPSDVRQQSHSHSLAFMVPRRAELSTVPFVADGGFPWLYQDCHALATQLLYHRCDVGHREGDGRRWDPLDLLRVRPRASNQETETDGL
jgi:hypothetical protein